MKAMILNQLRAIADNKNPFVLCGYAGSCPAGQRDFGEGIHLRRVSHGTGWNWRPHPVTEPPEKLDGIIDTTPAWKPVIEALACLKPGGRLIINAIRKEESDKKAFQIA